MSIFHGKKLVKKDDTEHDAESVVNDADVIAVYFSAHWCPPCRGFTPLLKKFFEDVNDKKLVIIFVSSDGSKEEMKSYFTNDHGDYYAVKFESTDLKKTLEDNCGVQGIPTLAVIDKQGKMVHKEGRADVTGKSAAEVMSHWKSKCI